MALGDIRDFYIAEFADEFQFLYCLGFSYLQSSLLHGIMQLVNEQSLQ